MPPKKCNHCGSGQCSGSAHHIDFGPLLEHWNNECRWDSQESVESYFEFTREEDSSSPDSVMCKRCNKLWAIGDLFTRECEVPSYTAPKFCCLQVSDTGKYMSWKKVTSLQEGLREGDEVAFLRCFRYWHHAIVYRVNGDDGSLQVVHWTCKGIRQDRISKCEVIENCCWSPMYKVYYPKDVEEQNPPKLVLLRAKYREGEKGYSLCDDNCEHLATFSKTGGHKSNQIYQWKVSLCGWMVRIIANLFLLALAVVLSEVIEEGIGPSREVIGAIMLSVFEFIYVILFCGITIRYDIRQETLNQINRTCRWCTSACRCATTKFVLQTALVVLISLLFSIGVVKNVEAYESIHKGDSRYSIRRAGWESLFGIIGGTIGNVLGFFLFSFYPCPFCCCREATERKARVSELELGHQPVA